MTPRTGTVLLPELVATTDARYALERYSVKQAATYLQVSVMAVYRLTTAGKIGYRREGAGRLVFSQRDLDTYRQSRRVEATHPQIVAVTARRAALAASSRPALVLPSTRRFS